MVSYIADSRRPDPETLLAEASREGRGKLKIFLGAAPGVGKTFEMLTAGKRRQGLFTAHSEDGGATFSEPQGFGDPDRLPSRPQVLAVGNRVWRGWKEFDGATTTALVQSSADGGRSWDAPRPVAATSESSDHPLLVEDGGAAYLSWLTKAEGYRLLPLSQAGR